MLLAGVGRCGSVVLVKVEVAGEKVGPGTRSGGGGGVVVVVVVERITMTRTRATARATELLARHS